MKIILAPDSFKNCLAGHDVAAALAAGLRAGDPELEIEQLPLSDGGEGFLETLYRTLGGRFVAVPAHDPLGRPITARYLRLPDGRAVVETAEASGLERLRPEELDPLRASTYGTGEVLLRALADGARELVIGLGGSATNDGGAGLLQGLGWRFRDGAGRVLAPGIGGGELRRIARLEAPELPDFRLVYGTDVTNPLLGSEGATAVFGPQKGVTPGLLPKLEAGLTHWRKLLARTFAGGCESQPGDGAAGGLGFGLRAACGGRRESGAELVLALVDFDRRLETAELVITGEGCTDGQSLRGKLCSVVAAHGARFGVPVVLISGALAGAPEALEQRFAACFSLADGVSDRATAIAQAGPRLFRQGKNLARLLKIGKNAKKL